jgi:indole-3-glycerol phosphate synthase
MSVPDLVTIKAQVHQPILRKDFIVEEYQIFEARAHGADAVLLMANILSRHKLKYIYETVRELGMDALFEVHTEREIDLIPEDAPIWGINSRKFMASRRWIIARKIAESKTFSRFWRLSKKADPIDLSAFNLVKLLPTSAIKVAESGIDPRKIKQIQNNGFSSALVGTSLLKDQRGIAVPLAEFEQFISQTPTSEFARVAAPVAA